MVGERIDEYEDQTGVENKKLHSIMMRMLHGFIRTCNVVQFAFIDKLKFSLYYYIDLGDFLRFIFYGRKYDCHKQMNKNL